MKIVVTGAGSGIGRAACLRLQRDVLARTGVGARIVVVDRVADRIDSVCAELRAEGAEPSGFQGDLSTIETCEALMRFVSERLGGLDLLVNNAGQGRRGALEALATQDWDEVFALVARAPWLLSKLAFPMLQAAGGTIVNVASMSGIQPQPGLGPYSSAKAALVMLTRQMAIEWAPKGIRVNAVSPGFIHTARVDWIYQDERRKADRIAAIPQGRIGAPEDIANVIAFLAGPDAAYMQGENVVVDGAFSLAAMCRVAH
ncbi:SDR family oxidoreductase [soil metagenome]